MSESDMTALLMQRYTSALSPLGRWRMQSYLLWKRLAWRWLVAGTLVVKRAVDIVGGLAALVLHAPVFLVIALLIKLEDRGPILFAQRRVGKYGREFKMYKFRSMCRDAEARLQELLARNHHAEGITFKIKDDPRITRVGRWIRKYSLDEVPQFYNVLIGDMSLVGPRPPVPREVSKYSLAQRRRLAIKPGITCLWQVGGRSQIDFSGQVQLDLQYIENQSFWGDIKILLKTIPAVLLGDGAC
jgi:exopolysaccharide biosynthesis polyprenyl glycosylphosphotransferase